jgi:hypothetical protein
MDPSQNTEAIMHAKSKKLVMMVILTLVFSSSPMLPSNQSLADSPLKYMSLLRVVNHYVPFHELSWELAAEVKESESFRWFEAAIFHFHEEEKASAVHLYKFDDTFYPWMWGHVESEEWIAHRESYRLYKMDIPPGLEREESSRLIAKAFIDIFTIMILDTPSQHYGLRYAGHSSMTGGLFENEITPYDAQWLFENVTAMLGRKIDFLDMSHNCAEGRMNVLTNFYPYFDYLLASDLLVGGYEMNDGDDYFTVELDYNYPQIISEEKTLVENLSGVLDLVHLRWVMSDIDMIERSVMQSLSLFDLAYYETMALVTYQALAIKPDPANYDYDLLGYIRSFDDHNEMENQFFSLRIDHRDNKDFFDWGYDMYGLSIMVPEWVEPNFALFPPFNSMLLRAGESIQAELLIRPLIGFDEPITFEAGELPPDTTVTFSGGFPPAGVSTWCCSHSPHRVTMTITTGDAITLGDHMFRVTATGGDKSYTVYPQITVARGIIYLPLLVK